MTRRLPLFKSTQIKPFYMQKFLVYSTNVCKKKKKHYDVTVISPLLLCKSGKKKNIFRKKKKETKFQETKGKCSIFFVTRNKG